MHLMDRVHQGDAPLRVLDVREDHGKKDGGELPGVAAHADRVENEILDEGGDADGGPEPQGGGLHDEEVEGLKKLVLGIEGGRLDGDRRGRLALARLQGAAS